MTTPPPPLSDAIRAEMRDCDPASDCATCATLAEARVEIAALRARVTDLGADLDEHRAALAETRRGLQAVEDYGRQKFDTSEGQRKAQGRRIMQQRAQLAALQLAHVAMTDRAERWMKTATAAETALRQAQAERDAAYQRGRDDERTDVVTFLRDLAVDEDTDDLSSDAHDEAADMIDLGEHVNTAPTPTPTTREET